tara:strand:- start:71 stop:478 length:408 start_codon:yes stop_codon:yes gene_type:complete
MKFQKDNTKIALTKEIKEEVIEKEKETIKIRKKIEQHEKAINEELAKIQDRYQDAVDKLAARQYAYAPVDVQLDMLWHDMDQGYIKVDKKRANTWYQHVKSVKDAYSLSSEWRQEILDIERDLSVLRANSNIEDV